MLTVTEDAKQYLKDTLQTYTSNADMSLRLVLGPAGRLGVLLGRKEDGDQVVEYEGAKLLLIAPELAPMVDGITLDVKDTGNGPKLTVTKE